MIYKSDKVTSYACPSFLRGHVWGIFKFDWMDFVEARQFQIFKTFNGSLGVTFVWSHDIRGLAPVRMKGGGDPESAYNRGK